VQLCARRNTFGYDAPTMLRAPCLALAALAACGSSSTSNDPGSGSTVQAPGVPGVDLPTVSGTGYAPTDLPPTLTASPREVAVVGKSVLALRDGEVDPAEVEGGKLGIRIPKLRQFVSHIDHGDTLTLAIDRTLSYRLFVQLLMSSRGPGFKKYALVARTNTSVVQVPIDLPERRPVEGGMANALGIRPRDPGSDLGKQVAEARSGGHLVAVGPARSSTRALLIAKQVAPSTSTLTADAVGRKVQSVYMAGIRRCAKTLTEATKVSIELAVRDSGHTANIEVRSPATDVATCIEGLASSWVFPRPRDPDGAPIEITAHLDLRIVPDPTPEPKRPPAVVDPSDASHASATMLIGEDEPHAIDPDALPLQLVISITKTQVIVWSISGLEGTLKEPKRVLPNDARTADEVGNTLAEIVKRRWGGKHRPESTLEILVMADGATPMQQVASVLGAVRETPAHARLFPVVHLSLGFE